MEDRKRALLAQIIKEYIKTACPVGSRCLEEKSRLGVSSATIRNEMAELEMEGYIAQPHTSAGRIPTEKGYGFFLSHLKEGKLASREFKELQEMLKKSFKDDLEIQLKQLAKKIAEFSNNAVVIGFSDNNLYYTGLSNLFSQPEFQNPELVYDISLVIDHLDQAMGEIFASIDCTRVLIGSKNPFSNHCSVVFAPWQFKNKSGIMGILGPMRMDYEKNLGLMNFIRNYA
ncbi:MAG: hypothetical protein WCV73_02910 [Patescibacteria group bacterium]|jgi:transcriptional regulator of heat shock response